MGATALVVGAGVFGTCIAHRLALEGWSVTIVDQAPPGHARATSSGDTRVLRCGHGEDRWYSEWAWRSRTLWRELEERVGQPMLVESGVAWFAHREGGWEESSAQTLTDLGIPTERLTPEEATRLWPSLGIEDLAWVLFEPYGGHLLARSAVQAIARHAVAHLGVRLILGHAEPAGAGVRIDGVVHHADHVVWAAGPWLGKLFGDDLVPISVVRRDYYFFGAEPEWASPGVPAWLDYDRSIYGVGDVDGMGFKVAPDAGEEPFDPDSGRRVAPPEGEREARAYLAERFRPLATAALVGARTCQYELTPDTRFVIARHPEHREVLIVGGGSGHGFKHGPVVAEYVAGLLADPDREPEPQFALGPRTSGTSLRTAAAPIGAA